jgi:hypothetical protein
VMFWVVFAAVSCTDFMVPHEVKTKGIRRTARRVFNITDSYNVPHETDSVQSSFWGVFVTFK